MNKINQSFINGIARYGVVGCRHRVIIVRPADDMPKDERVWTLMVEQDPNRNSDVVVAWYKTRDAARKHAKSLRKVLKQLVVV